MSKKEQKYPFEERKKLLDKSLCLEIRYYHKEAHKAIYKSPALEQQVAWNEKKCCSKCGKNKYLMVFMKNNCGGGNIIKSDGRRNRRPDCKVCYERDIKGKEKAIKCAKIQCISYKAPEGTICKLCSKLGTDSNPLVFDHNHEKDVFRGYICNRCNIGFGIHGDNVPSIIKRLCYLNETEGWSLNEIIDMLKNYSLDEN